MQKIIDNGFTLYVRKGENGFVGTGLRNLGRGAGMEPIEVKQENLSRLEELPSITKRLESGDMLQMYHYGFCYFLSLGKTCKEGPNGEKDCFDVMCEGIDFTLNDALINLEERASNLEEDLPLKKAYRLYGSDKYECIKW